MTLQTDLPASPSLNALLNDAIVAYAELANLRAGNYWDTRRVADLNESRTLDPSGLTTFLMLRGMMQDFLQSATMSAADILADPDGFMRKLSHMRAVKGAVEAPETDSLILTFQDALRRAATHFTFAERGQLEEFLAEDGNLGLIRRDALRSMETLTAVQFTQGAPDTKPLQVNRTIFEFWNINSLLAALQQQHIAGVSLCLIRDPEELMASFFVFAVKNGDTITILTDRQAVPHPGFWAMARRKDRVLDERASRHWFPYDLLGLTEVRDADGRKKGLIADQRTALVPLQSQLVALSTLGALSAPEFAWAVLVLERIAERYGRENRRLPELAYTGQMVLEPEALVSGSSALVRQGDYAPLALAPLTPADVTAATTRAQWQNQPLGVHEWMIDAYGAQVPGELLNVVGQGQRTLLAETFSTALGIERTRDPFSRAPKEIEALAPTTFGTQQQIVNDRLWAARMNQCRAVQVLADRAYAEESPAVLAWCRERVAERRGIFLSAVGRRELRLTMPDGTERVYALAEHARGRSSFRMTAPANKSEVYTFIGGGFYGNHVKVCAVIGARDQARTYGYTCAMHPNRGATVFASFEPTNADEIAAMLGVPLEELPPGLRHWYGPGETPYNGNHILNRLDPSDWALSNPWKNFPLRILIALSKTGLKQLTVDAPMPTAAAGAAAE